MLEFAYTGEVNVAQDLLPSLLHTARSFRIKGLDKVENPVDAPPPVSLVTLVLDRVVNFRFRAGSGYCNPRSGPGTVGVFFSLLL